MDKRQLIRKGLLVLLFFCGVNYFLTAKGETLYLPNHVQIVDNGDEGGKPGDPDDLLLNDCPTPFTFRLKLANLRPFRGDLEGSYGLPPGASPILFRCTVGQEVFDFYPTIFTPMGLGVAQEVYEWQVTVEVDMEANCEGNPSIIIQTTQILTLSGAIYPISNHADAGGIFSCEVFAETAGCCSGGNCDDEEMSESELEYEANCREDCDGVGTQEPYNGNQEQGPDHDEGGIGGGGQTADSPSATELMFFPNPFENYMILELELATNQPVTVIIRNTTGQEVWQQTTEGKKGINQTQIDTQHWSSGIYFAQITYRDQMKSVRLSKF